MGERERERKRAGRFGVGRWRTGLRTVGVLRTVRGRRRAVQAVMVLCVLALLPSTWTHAVAADRLRTTAEAPDAGVAVVFGAACGRAARPRTWRTGWTRPWSSTGRAR